MAFEVFISYSHHDRALRRELDKHLSNLKRQNVITSWSDADISSGMEWRPQIIEHLNTAQVILLLVSSDFMSSDFCYSVEMMRAIARHDANEARIIPILLRPTDWEGAPFAKLKVLPTNAKPITRWSTYDDAFADVVRGIRMSIGELMAINKPISLSADSSIIKSFRSIASSWVPIPIWNVPYDRNPFFTGFEEVLSRLHMTLKTSKTVALTQPQAISGLGGIGKTQLAVEYAYRHRNNYNAILWAKSESRESLISDFVAIANTLKLQERQAQEQYRAVEAVKRWLQSNTEWLFIFDNADDLAILQDFLPSSGKGDILLTTRAYAVGRIAQRIELERMEPDVGALFLLRRARLLDRRSQLDTASMNDCAVARDISIAMNGSPLALDQAGAFIKETQCSLSDYLLYYYTLQRDLLRRRGGQLTDHPDFVNTTLTLSFERILNADLAAADLLRLLAFLGPEGIPEEMITKGALELPRSVNDDSLILNQAIGTLLTYSLIHRTSDRTLTIHRLIQAVLQDSMGRKVQRRWAERAIRMVNHVFPEVVHENWLLCQQYIPHVLVCAALIDQWHMAFPEAAQLLSNAGHYLTASGQYEQAEAFLQRALAILDQMLGPDHCDTADGFENLADLYQAQGQYERAEPFYQRALAIREQVLGLDHLDTAKSLNSLALLYQAQGQYERAEPLYQRALMIQEQVLGLDHLDTAKSLNSLASFYQAQGQYERAEPLYHRALAIQEQALGSDHLDMAVGFNNLALLHWNQRNYEQAEMLLKRALMIQEQSLGFDHPDTAISLNNLASLYEAQGKFEQAEPLYQRALAIQERALGPDYSDTASSLNNLAVLYKNQGKFEQAEPLYQRALAIQERALGSEHPNTANSLENLANLYYNQGKFEQAESLYQRALAIQERALGPEHPNAAIVLNRLTTLYYIQGKYKEAEPLFQHILTNSRSVLESKSLDAVSDTISLAWIYYEQSRYEQARSLLRQALTTCERELGFQHPDTATGLSSLSLLYLVQDKHEQASPLYQQALSIYELAIKTKHPSLAPNFTAGDEKSLNLELNYFNMAINLNELGLLLQKQSDITTSHRFFELILKILECPPACQYTYIADQRLTIQKIRDWLETIIQDMDTAQTSPSRLARTTALGRAVSMLSDAPTQLDALSWVGQLLLKRITDRWREIVTREVGHASKLELLTEIPSPYIFSVPVRDQALVGRDDLFRRITALWSVPNQRNSLLIYGHRRMGKTSLAQALKSRCDFGEDTYLVYLDISGIKVKREGDLYYEIAERLWLLVEEKMIAPDRKHFTSAQARSSLNRFLTRFHKIAEKSRVILVIDEFELLHKYLGLEATFHIIENLRAHTQTYHWLTLALVGLNDLEDLGRSYENPLLGWEPIHVRFLDASQVARVLANPPSDLDFPLDYTPKALAMIATVTNGQPYLVQVIGHLLVQFYNETVFDQQKEHSGAFSEQDVQEIINDAKFYDRASAYFKGVWGQATNGKSEEVALLKALAQENDGIGEGVLQIAAELDEIDFMQSLVALERHDILYRKSGYIHYAVPLMRQWVQKNYL